MKDPHALLDKHGLMAKWGLVAERTSDPKVREAIALILGYEADRLDTSPRFDLPADQAQAKSAYEYGKQEGLGMAFEALCNSDYITQQRDLLKDMIDEETPDNAGN